MLVTSLFAKRIFGRLVIGSVGIVSESLGTSLPAPLPPAIALRFTAELFDRSFRHDVRYDILCETALLGAGSCEPDPCEPCELSGLVELLPTMCASLKRDETP